MMINEDYDEDEVAKYAQCIGIHPDTEPHLLWIAIEGINAPLPENWKPCQDQDGKIYYFNFATGESSLDRPCDGFYKKMVIDQRRTQQKQGEAAANTKAEPALPKDDMKKKKDTMSNEKMDKPLEPSFHPKTPKQ